MKTFLRNNNWEKKKKGQQKLKYCCCGVWLQKTPASLQRLALSYTWWTPNWPPAPFFCSDVLLAKYRLFIATILGQSLTHRRTVQCAAPHLLPQQTTFFFFLHMCCNQCRTHGPLYLKTSSFTNAISLLAKRGPRQCKHHAPTHENFRINDSFSEAAMWVAAV